MRMFVGVALSSEAREALERLTLRLRAPEDGLRWSSPDQWHITLVFLGEAADRPLGELQRRLKRLRLAPVELALEGLGTFESAGVLYAAVNVTPGLTVLQAAIAAAAREFGFAPDDRPNRPHITLARSRNPAGKSRLRELNGSLAQQPLHAAWRAEEFLLYESRLSPTGSKYIVRQRFALR